jgi:Uma2 family endonuclease
LISAERGVRHLWIVDPTARTLEVLRNHEGQWLVASVHGEDDVIRAEPFDAVELRLGRLWGLD